MSATLDLRNKKESVSFDETRPEVPSIGITRAKGDNSTALATTAFVQEAIQTGSDVLSVFGRTGNIVAQDGDYTVAQVTGAAPLLSPAFTGDPTAPTPATSDNSFSIATTAYVQAQTWAQSQVVGLVTALSACEKTANKNQVSGYAGLDTSSLLNAAQLPLPGASTLGGVKSLAAVTKKYLTSIGTDGGPVAQQPRLSDLSDANTVALLSGPSFTAPVEVIDNAIGSSQTSPVSGLLLQNNTVSTGSQQQDPPALEFDGTYWTGSASATGSLVMAFHFAQSGGVINSKDLSFLFTGTPGSAQGFVAYKDTAAATSSLNVPAPVLAWEGNIWNGSASAQETWEMKNTVGTGGNPTSLLSILHFGSSGAATLDLSNGGGVGTAFSVLVPTANPLTSSTVAASTSYADAAVTVERGRATTAEALLAPLASAALTGTPTLNGINLPPGVLYSYAGSTDTIEPNSNEVDFSTSHNLGANYLTGGRVLRVTIILKVVFVSSQALALNLKLGNTSVYTATQLSTTNTAGTYRCGLVIYIQGTAAAGNSVAVYTDHVGTMGTTSGALSPVTNNTVSQPVNLKTNGILSVQPGMAGGASAAGASVTLEQFIVEGLN